jgi:hypothetical protein
MEKKRRQMKRLKKIIIAMYVGTFLLLFPSLLGGLSGLFCWLFFVSIMLLFLVLIPMIYLTSKFTVKAYDQMWEDFKKATIEQGLEPLKDSPPEISAILKKSSGKSSYDRYPIFGTKQEIWGRTVWTWFWKYLGNEKKDNQGSAGYEYLVAMTRVPGLKGWINVRHEGPFNFGILGNDIDFEDPDFSEMFHVGASSKRLAFDFFHPRMMEFWKEYGKYEMKIKDEWIFIFKSEQGWNIFRETFWGCHYDIKPLIEFQEQGVLFLEEVIERIPNYLMGGDKIEAVEFEDEFRADVEQGEILEL